MTVLLAYFVQALSDNKSQLDKFYELTKSPNAITCQDKTLLMPDCTRCIPGLVKKEACRKLSPSTVKLRNEFEGLTTSRFGKPADPKRKYALYPYLEQSGFLIRQRKFGALIEQKKPKHILDIGSYYNPIHLFIGSHCPESVVIFEPLLDALSIHIPCSNTIANTSDNQFTHVAILPMVFHNYNKTKNHFPSPDAIVCIGCDAHYGPNRNMLETSFKRPYTLYLEYPHDYFLDEAFHSMPGKNEGAQLLLDELHEVDSNMTDYYRRHMKVIQYD